MREILVVVGALLGAAALTATNGGPEPTTPRAVLDPQEARAYAEQLLDVVNRVSSEYVRPIERQQLVFAALSGLYEAAGLPVPASLSGDLARLEVQVPPRFVTDDQDAERRWEEANQRVLTWVAEIRKNLGNGDNLRGPAALRVSLQALTKALDPYSVLVDGRELQRTNGAAVNRGLGIELTTEDVVGPLRVKSVVLGSPAQRAAIKPGNQIIRVDGVRVGDNNRALLAHHLLGTDSDQPRDGKTIELKVRAREDEVPRRLTLEYQFFRPETALGVRRDEDEGWNYLLDAEHKIGYVRIGSLEHGTADQLQQALARLQDDELRGLILDLRWSPGGFLNEAVQIARLFLKDGVIATVRSRKDDQAFPVDGNGPHLVDFPMVVLVNGATSGGAELIAAALQDHKRAVIAGQRTFGKASVQTMLPQQLDNLGLRLTTGQFIRPSGKTLHRSPESQLKDDWGVRPEAELEMPMSPDLSEQLRDEWLRYSLRPSGGTQRLLLDDPENDPQRQLALQALRNMVK